MATGRVGGTKAKIRGQVGNEIYQIRKNEDGTYTQIVLEKGVRTETETSERLQAQRMCTAMVEAFMRDVKLVGQISMQSAKNKTASLNALSSFNLKLVAQDCKDHWYGGNDFFYPYMNNKGTITEQVGGCYLLSSGSLTYDFFDSVVSTDESWKYFNGVLYWYEGFAFLNFEGLNPSMSVADFLKARRMSRLDYVVLVVFRSWFEWDSTGEERDHYTKHEYIIAQINPEIGDQERLTSQNLQRLFRIKSSGNYRVVVSRDETRLGIGFIIDYYNSDERIYFAGGFSISYLTGKKLVSSSAMISTDEMGGEFLAGGMPTSVFYSWMRARVNPHWPSPFE